MLAVPTVSASANPVLAPILATAGVSELQLTTGLVVTSCVELSVQVPVATNCWLAPIGMTAVPGATSMDARVAELTLKLAVPADAVQAGR